MGLEHIHMTVNARIDSNFSELSKEKAHEFVNELMKTIKMKPLGPLNWATASDLDFPGQSFVQMITTSHCSIHFFQDAQGNGENNELYFDLYSCRCYDVNKVVGLIDKYFGIKEWHGIVYDRRQGFAPNVQITGSGPVKESLVLKETGMQCVKAR